MKTVRKFPYMLPMLSKICCSFFTESRMKLYLKYAQLLECFGFKLIFGHILDVPQSLFTENGETRSCCYELVWAQDKQW